MGLWDAVTSVCSSVGSAISSTFGSVTSAVGGVLSSVATVMPAIDSVLKSLTVAMPYVNAIVSVVNVALKIVGLLKGDETVGEIGDRALQAQEAGIKPADFSTYDEYMEEIRNFELDPKKSEKYNLGEKLAAGVTVQSWGMEEKLGDGSSGLLALVIKDAPNLAKGEGYFTEERVEAILKSIDNIADVSKYFSDKLDPDTSNKIEEQLVGIEKDLSPEKSIDDIYQQLDQQKQNG